MSLVFLFYFLVPLGAVGFFGWLALRFVRARERDSLHGAPSDSGDLRKLEDHVQDLQAEIQSIRERQDFMEKLLERPGNGEKTR